MKCKKALGWSELLTLICPTETMCGEAGYWYAHHFLTDANIICTEMPNVL
jgi:hypothetical protein